jgi:hypothetical protein
MYAIADEQDLRVILEEHELRAILRALEAYQISVFSNPEDSALIRIKAEIRALLEEAEAS